ncbi:hypothetical protein TRV_00153, partial [Trichophyton verrucosum HKI 0517]
SHCADIRSRSGPTVTSALDSIITALPSGSPAAVFACITTIPDNSSSSSPKSYGYVGVDPFITRAWLMELYRPLDLQEKPVLYHSRTFDFARDSSRDTVCLRVVLTSETASRLLSNPNLRIMVYGAADNGLTHYSPSDIAFPHQVELKVNHDDVKANLRGLKNKPGTTRPADITNFIRKKVGYVNTVTMTYALTQKVVPHSSMQIAVKQLT